MSSLIDFPESKGLNRRAGNSKEEADDGEKEHPEATIRSPRKVRMVKEHRADQSGGNASCALIAKKLRRSPHRFAKGASRRSSAGGEFAAIMQCTCTIRRFATQSGECKGGGFRKETCIQS